MMPRRKHPSRPSASPSRKTTRRWRVPPPLIHGPEALEAGSVLGEVEGPLGVILWHTLRDVMLWAATAPEERARLFSPTARRGRQQVLAGARLAPELRRALGLLAELLGSPEEMGTQEVAAGCRAVAEWAEENGLLATGLAYTQAVALAEPESAPAAHVVGVLARRRGEYARAETWFRRAVMLSRQSGDWPTYALAFDSLGKLYIHRGNFPTARKLLVRSRRAARRHGLRHLEGMALHNLFVIAANGMETAEAEGYAAAALEAYGPRHPDLPRLAHDVAYFWLESGHFARALPVFRAVLPRLSRLRERMRVTADIARAAAGVGERGLFETSWEETLEMARGAEDEEGAAQALLDLAYGAAMLGEWERAEGVVTRALKKATERNEGKIRLMAEALLESVQRGRKVEAPRVPARGTEPTPGDALASELVEVLSAASDGSAAETAGSSAF